MGKEENKEQYLSHRYIRVSGREGKRGKEKREEKEEKGK